MASTTLQLVQRIRDILTDSGTRETFSDDFIIRSAINPIARDLAILALTEADSTTVTTVAGQKDYSLPAAIVPFVKFSAVTIGSSRKPLMYADNSQIADYIDQGEPEYWAVFGNTFKLVPVPDATYTVYIDAYNGSDVATEQDPAASTDELGLTPDVEDALVWGCAELLSAINREGERQRDFGQMYRQRVALLRQKLQPDAYQPAQIGVSDPSDAYFYEY